MKPSTWIVALLVALSVASFSGCTNPEEKTLSEQEKKQIDDDMKKAIEQNKPKKSS
jgi:hypothetical protein